MNDAPTWAWTPRIIKNRIRKMEERIRRDPKDYSAHYCLKRWQERLAIVERMQNETQN